MFINWAAIAELRARGCASVCAWIHQLPLGGGEGLHRGTGMETRNGALFSPDATLALAP